MSYWRFAAMIATSTVVMFGLMYLNTYVWAHVFWSETRAYMAVLMGASMAIIMLSFMLGMYRKRAINAAIYALAVVAFGGSLWLVRSQATVDGESYMRAMIPHHSIAILTSNRSNIEDPRVRKLADEIIAAQQKEISEMRYLIAALEGEVDAEVPPSMQAPEAPAPVADVEGALARPTLATLDAADMTAAEIDRATGGAEVRCRFTRTARSDPILVTWAGDEGARAAMKLSGRIVPLAEMPGTGQGTLPGDGRIFRAEGLRLEIVPRDEDDTADLRFTLSDGLTVGYRGEWACA
jgi:hypothetical protein